MERTGILGRLADILSANGNHVNKFTVDRDSAPVEGMRESSKVILDTFKGFSKFNEGGNRTDFLLQNAELLNGNVEEGFNNVFSDAWSSTLVRKHFCRRLTLFLFCIGHPHLPALDFLSFNLSMWFHSNHLVCTLPLVQCSRFRSILLGTRIRQYGWQIPREHIWERIQICGSDDCVSRMSRQ